ncbi:hypothetical protein SAMCCGM7_pC1975 (plasmid) [Sinorhizobium americanum CCGM7]|nr:hypothetical protein SAMCCGM7_pC1975 [Sinorhizobium americanum CCGM7]
MLSPSTKLLIGLASTILAGSMATALMRLPEETDISVFMASLPRPRPLL